MADEEFKGEEKARFPALLVFGLGLAVVVNVVAFVVDSEIGIPVLVLTVICALAAVGYRLIAGGDRGSDSDSSDNIPKQAARSERPLGDTPEAHDEITPHDLPLDHPGREEAEELAGGSDGTTRGPLPGG
jgi:hypothetical protein